MAKKTDVQFAQLVNMDEPYAVFEETKNIFIQYYHISEFDEVRTAFRDFNRLYEGKYPGYSRCNTKYHDKIHTTDALLAMARLIDGYNQKHKVLPVRKVKAALIATLFHDAGYIQRNTDHKGTGAKFTLNHVDRSVDFLKEYLKKIGFKKEDARFAGNIVQCTGLSVSIFRLNFENRAEKVLGLMLGTSDLIGQMASRTYLERLLHLYREFKEGHVSGYTSEYDLLSKTKRFYDHMKVRLNGDLEDIQRYAAYHFAKRYDIHQNLYLVAIEKHMIHLDYVLKAGPKRFIKKLKRNCIFK